MPVDDIRILKETRYVGKAALPESRTEELPRKEAASLVIRNDGEPPDIGIGEEDIVEAQKPRIDCGRMLHFKETLNCLSATRDPDHVNLR